jgi:hypothetical protein
VFASISRLDDLPQAATNPTNRQPEKPRDRFFMQMRTYSPAPVAWRDQPAVCDADGTVVPSAAFTPVPGIRVTWKHQTYNEIPGWLRA